MLLVEWLAGSKAFGTDNPDSDTDKVRIVVEPMEQVLGLGKPLENKHEHSDSGDITTYSLRNYLKLALAGNPSVLETLWCPVLDSDDELMLAELYMMRHAFIGRHFIPRFRGYMKSQADKLLGNKHGTNRKELVSEHGYDTKFAMHTLRLGLECRLLLETRELPLPIPEPDLECLRLYRMGTYPLSTWERDYLQLDAKLAILQDRDDIPAHPDTGTVDAWCIDAHLRTWDVGHAWRGPVG